MLLGIPFGAGDLVLVATAWWAAWPEASERASRGHCENIRRIASDLLDVVADLLQVDTNGDGHGAWSSWLRGEQIDVHRRPLDQAVGEEGVSTSESEAMGTGRGQGDASDILLERVETHGLRLGHVWTGTSSSQAGVALLPGCSYHRREVELGPQLHQGVALEPPREVLDAARLQQHHPVHQLARVRGVEVIELASRSVKVQRKRTWPCTGPRRSSRSAATTAVRSG